MNPDKGSTFVYRGVNFGFPNPFVGLDQECHDIIALDLLNHAGVDIPRREDGEIIIEALEISSYGIHIKANGKDFWLRTHAYASFEELVESAGFFQSEKKDV